MSDSKRKILFLVETLDSGDAGKALSVLVQYIDKTKYDVTVCAINGGGQYEPIIKENVNYKARSIAICPCHGFISSMFLRGMMWKLPILKVLP